MIDPGAWAGASLIGESNSSPRSAPEYHQTQAPNATTNIGQPAESCTCSFDPIPRSFRLRTAGSDAGNAIAVTRESFAAIGEAECRTIVTRNTSPSLDPPTSPEEATRSQRTLPEGPDVKRL
jgi:hypothetical protein